jgi:fibronectin-binding autotransporter adhesin
LEIDGNDRLGNATNTVEFYGAATLRTSANFTIARSFYAFGSNKISAASGTTLTFNTPFTLAGGYGLTFDGGGTIEFNQSAADSNGPLNAVTNGTTVRLKHATALGSIGAGAGGTVELAGINSTTYVALDNGGILRTAGNSSINFVDIYGGMYGDPNVYIDSGTNAANTLTIGSGENTFAQYTYNGPYPTIHAIGSGTLIFPYATTNNRPISIDSGTVRMMNAASLGYISTVTLNGGKLEVAAGVAAPTRNIAVSATGGGLVAGGNASLGDIDGVGTVIKSGAGTLTVSHVRSGGLDVSTGAVSIAQGIGDAGTSRLGTLALAGKLDVTDNGLIVTGQTAAEVEAMVAAGRAGGSWSGIGIITSMSAAASGLTTIGVARAIDIGAGTFGGVSVGGNDVLVRYTYIGDANLSGKVDGDDFGKIDAGFSAHASGFVNGDFNYSGTVDADDYWLIDRIYSRNLPSLGAAPPLSGGASAVPEPSTVLIASAATVRFTRRRRRPR